MVIRFTNKQKAEITDMVYRYRDELIHKGFDVKRITAVKFTERCYRRYGQCTSRSNENWAIITISSICLKGTKETLREVIMHELVHAMNGVKHGHGASFHAMARRVNAFCGTHIDTYIPEYCVKPAMDFLKETNARRNKEEWKYEIICPNCGAKFHYKRMSKFVKDVMKNGGTTWSHCCGQKGGFELRILR